MGRQTYKLRLTKQSDKSCDRRLHRAMGVQARTDQVGMAEDEEIGQDSRVAEKMLTIWSRLSRNASQKIILGTQHRT